MDYEKPKFLIMPKGKGAPQNYRKNYDQIDWSCQKCGQKASGQSGEYPCDACGLPTTHDYSCKCPKCYVCEGCANGFHTCGEGHPCQCTTCPRKRSKAKAELGIQEELKFI